MSINLGYIHINTNIGWWRFMWLTQPYGIFRNLPHVRPGRWGFYVLGFEFGSRNPGDPVGVWLKNHGLWPW
jgi:hypothetical protein